MNKELQLWSFVSRNLSAGENVVLLVVGESLGSSPGRQGFKMAVTPVELNGSIGGGIMEVKLVEQARDLLCRVSSPRVSKGANSFITYQSHRKNSEAPSGMICSGKQTVIFRLLTAEDAETVDSIIESIEKRHRNIVTISPDRFTTEPPEDGSQNPDFTFETESVPEFLYRERLGPKNDLYIVGGGHCALALSELMSKMNFYIRLFDDRPDLNTISKNSFAHEKHVVENYERIGEDIPGGANVYVVVMTLGYASDEIVIRQFLDKTFKYFGVLGSKAKMAQLLNNLRKEGHAKERLDGIRTPIGLSINSQTPEEIAISIAAEIISVKNT